MLFRSNRCPLLAKAPKAAEGVNSRACLLVKITPFPFSPPDYKASRKTKINLALFRVHEMSLRVPLISRAIYNGTNSSCK